MLAQIREYFGASAVHRRVRQRRVSREYAAEIQQLEPRVVFTSAIVPAAVSTVVFPPVVASAADQYMLQLLNRGRANPVAEAARMGIDLNEGLPAGTLAPVARQPLALNASLQTSIENHLADELAHNFFGHVGSNGSTLDVRDVAAGYTNWISVGENLSWMPAEATLSLEKNIAQQYVNLFVDHGITGRSHRTNFLNGNLREIGSAIRTGKYQGYNSVLTGEELGLATGNPFVTGVVYNDAAKTGFYAMGEGLGGVTISVSGAGGIAYRTTSNAAGGYQIPLPAGTYSVVFSGTGIAAPIMKSFTIGTLNVQVDANTRTDKGVTTPVVTADPLTQTVRTGTAAVFSATAIGSPVPTVQWQVSTNGGVSYVNIASATSSTYSFTGNVAQNGYTYRAVFMNTHGSATTKAAKLTVLAAPVVTKNPLSQSITIGQTATFTAAATGSPTPTVQWQVSTNGGTTFTNIAGATASTYRVSVTAAQSGNKYRADFSNSQGKATTSVATLSAIAAFAVPAITQNPTSQSVVSSAKVTFAAAATGSPTPTIQWQVSTDGGNTFINVAAATSKTYTFTALAAQNRNQYRAVFSNSRGSVITKIATLSLVAAKARLISVGN